MYVTDIDPSIQVNLKYFGKDNFIGKVIPGYKANKAILTKQAAEALAQAQKKFKEDGYSILIYDAYRPQKAVTYFMDWIKNQPDEERKQYHFPRVDKKDLVNQGYVAEKSGHSKGSTLDMTIIKDGVQFQIVATPKSRIFNGVTLPFLDDNSIDCGTSFDLMDKASHGENEYITGEYKKNRDYIKEVMESFNFKVLNEEWWHFTLNNEPYPSKFFDFDVE